MPRFAMADQRTLLITGATGFLGSHLALAFLGCGYRLKILARSRGAGSELRLKRILDAIQPTPLLSDLLSGQLELVQGDVAARHLGLSARTVLRLAAEVTDVVHCAAMVSFDPTKAGELQAVNVEGTRNVLEFARMMKSVVLHYVSTAFVVGRRTGLIRESDLDRPAEFNNTYEESKFLAEVEVRKAAAEGLPTVIYRPGILVGDSQTGQTQSFFGFYTFLRALVLVANQARRLLRQGSTDPLVKWLDTEQKRIYVPLRAVGSETKTLNVVPVDYVVQVALAIFQRTESLGQTFHIVHHRPPTLGQLRDWICSTLGMKGGRFVSRAEFQKSPMNRWERLFHLGSKEYAAYLQGEEPIFSTENTTRVIQAKRIPIPPPIDEHFIRLLTMYCLKSRWGKRLFHEPIPVPVGETAR